jgi:hypothetical protein
VRRGCPEQARKLTLSIPIPKAMVATVRGREKISRALSDLKTRLADAVNPRLALLRQLIVLNPSPLVLIRLKVLQSTMIRRSEDSFPSQPRRELITRLLGATVDDARGGAVASASDEAGDEREDVVLAVVGAVVGFGKVADL